MEKNKRLSKNLNDIINDPQNSIFLSAVSIWEIVLKKAKGKLKTSISIEKGIKTSGFTPLPIETSHVLGVEQLPTHHKDPFDRLLVAQAIVEKLMIITEDEKIKKYDVSVLA